MVTSSLDVLEHDIAPYAQVDGFEPVDSYSFRTLATNYYYQRIPRQVQRYRGSTAQQLYRSFQRNTLTARLDPFSNRGSAGVYAVGPLFQGNSTVLRRLPAGPKVTPDAATRQTYMRQPRKALP